MATYQVTFFPTVSKIPSNPILVTPLLDAFSVQSVDTGITGAMFIDMHGDFSRVVRACIRLLH